MSLFGRIIVIFFALVVAIMIAGITLAIGIIAPDWTGVDSDPFERVSFFVISFFATSFIYYGVGGALVGLASYFGSNISVRLENTTDVAPVGNALQLAAAAGIIGGIVYWLIAGRNAGRWREPRPI